MKQRKSIKASQPKTRILIQPTTPKTQKKSNIHNIILYIRRI